MLIPSMPDKPAQVVQRLLSSLQIECSKHIQFTEPCTLIFFQAPDPVIPFYQGGSVRFRTISILNESVPFVSVRFGSVPLIFRFGSVRCRLFCGPVRFDLSGPNSIAYDYMNDGLWGWAEREFCWCSLSGCSQFQLQAMVLKSQHLEILVRQTRPENKTVRFGFEKIRFVPVRFLDFFGSIRFYFCGSVRFGSAVSDSVPEPSCFTGLLRLCCCWVAWVFCLEAGVTLLQTASETTSISRSCSFGLHSRAK